MVVFCASKPTFVIGNSVQINYNQMFSQALRFIRKFNNGPRKFSSQPIILTENINNNTVVTLNRPKSLNAMTADLCVELYNTLTKLEKNSSLIILKGAGDKSFSAGGDLIKLREAGEVKNIKYLHDMVLYSHINAYLMFKYKTPVIVLMNGYTYGGGAGLSIFCKYRIATEKTKFGMPEAKIAFLPNVAATHFLNRAPGKLGYYMGLTGNVLTGSDVLRAGYATHFCHSSKVKQLEEDLLKCSNEVEVEYVIENNCERNIPNFSLTSVMDNINSCFSGDTVEDILLKLNQDASVWAKETLDELNKYSPTSLKVILRQLQKGRTMGVADCLTMETNLTFNFYKFPDVYEGTRIRLVDREDTPKWNPSHLSDVTEELIESHFAPAVEEKFEYLIKEVDSL